MYFSRLYISLAALVQITGNIHYFNKNWGPYDHKYGHFPESQRLRLLEEARQMFAFGYDNYMKHAFPKDELDPIHCTGRGPDVENPSNININDVLGDYALTLVDTLDTLAVMGNSSEFKKAVGLVIDNVSFDKQSTIQVFEATIRVLGALISAHLIIVDSEQPFGHMVPENYDSELLHMAHELAARLLPAFEKTATGIPFPRVNLSEGVPVDCINETCTSGAGTLVLEFALLSRLLGDPVYESVARRAVKRLWAYRSNVTGLFGNVINIQTGEWVGIMSGLGAGIDSFFEYMFKSFIMFGNPDDLKMFNESYETIKYYLRKGRKQCNEGTGHPPIYVNVHMKSGDVINNWIDSLQAAWPGVQVLNGDVEEAICVHAMYYAIWRRYGALPERFNWNLKVPDVRFYPLRPELVESTYLLYQATKNPFYLHVGKDILESLNNHTKVECGYATIHDVTKRDHEDRMESFFLSETCKYLYLLFDTDNHLNKEPTKYLFSTEGHILPVKREFRRKPWDENEKSALLSTPKLQSNRFTFEGEPIVVDARPTNFTNNCNKLPAEKSYFLPIGGEYLRQIEELVGLIPSYS